MPDKEVPILVSLLDQPGIPPKKAISILENLLAMDPAQRAEVCRDAKHPDPHVRDNALAKAAALPPVPDPALVLMTEARECLRRAGKVCRVESARPEILALADGLHTLIQTVVSATGGHPV